MSNNTHLSLLSQDIDEHSLRTQLIDILTTILVILGVTGNILGLLIFSSSRRFRRISNIYVKLANYSSITNLLCLLRYASILHSTTRNFLRHLVGQTWWACKFYEFSFSFRVLSSWITLFWMFERLTCVSRRLRRFCHRFNTCHLKYIIPIVIIIIIMGCVIGPPVSILSNDTRFDCYLNSNVSISWQIYFRQYHLGLNHFTVRCLFSELIPTGAVVLSNSCILSQILRTRCYLHQTNDRRQIQTASWMNVILLLHSSSTHEAWWVLLAVLINCSLNFYAYCLSGNAFRNEIRRFFYCCCCCPT